MTAKEYLTQLLNLEMYIRTKQEDYEMALTRATQSTRRHQEVVVQTSRNLAKQEDIAAKCAEISSEIDRATSVLLDLQREARELIESLEDNRFRAVLTERYILCKDWKTISENLNFSYWHVHKLHGYALVEIEKKMDTLGHKGM